MRGAARAETGHSPAVAKWVTPGGEMVARGLNSGYPCGFESRRRALGAAARRKKRRRRGTIFDTTTMVGADRERKDTRECMAAKARVTKRYIEAARRGPLCAQKGGSM